MGAEPQEGSVAGYPTDVNAYIKVGEDGRITVFSGKIEMGQGVETSMAQMIAEDLGTPLDQIDMIMGDTDTCPYDQGTWGSMTTRFFGPALRAAAANAKAMLVELAAERLAVPGSDLRVEEGTVVVTGDPSRRVTFAQLVGGRRLERTLSEAAVQKAVADFQVMGTSPRRLDARAKVTGEALYAGDIRLPGMLYARILRPPAHDSALTDVETSKAAAVEGTTIVNQDGIVAVLHADPEMAERALGLVDAKYETPASDLTEENIFEHLLAGNPQGRTADQRGSLEVGRHAAETTVEMTYVDGYKAHAPMEPHTALARYEDGRITIWGSTQSPFGDRNRVATALGLPRDQVRVITPYVGGGFGGKGTNLAAIEAARLARITGKPVMVAWTRAEEFFLDTFRPAAIVKITSGLDASGRLCLWDYHSYYAGSRGAEQLYDIPNSQLTFYGAQWGSSDQPLATGPWRAPGANTNIFAKESQVDIMAARAGVDPIEFRLRHLSDSRLRRVIEAVAEAATWKAAASPSGRGLGVAIGTDAGACVAHIAEVNVDKATGAVRVTRVVCAQEMGVVVSPMGATMQMEGCITMGLGYALAEDIRFKGKAVLDRNFDTYEIPRLSWMPAIETVLVRNDALSPQGGGEPAIVCMGAAVANAVFDAVGARVRQLPVTPGRVLEAIGRAGSLG
jgi:isoquinoline 1-oxidoreductase